MEKKYLLIIILSTAILFTACSKYTDSNYEINNEVNTLIEENKMTKSEALSICTNKLKNINAYEYRYGKGIVSSESDKYYYITYDSGESYAVNIYTKEVYYVVPSGDGLNGPL